MTHCSLLPVLCSIQRTYGRIVSEAGAAIDKETRSGSWHWVSLHAVDQKRKDAIAALRYIRDITGKDQE